MKKRVFSLLLAFAMVGAMGLPARALETTTPAGEGWRTSETAFLARYALEYAAAHQEEYAAFDEETYKNLVDQLGSQYKAELMAVLGIDEASFREILWTISLENEEIEEKAARAWWAAITQAYEAEFPGDIDAVGLPMALTIFGYDSVEAFAQNSNETVETAQQYLAALYVESRQHVATDHEAALNYREQYPGSYESFDPDDGYEGDWAHMKGNTMAQNTLQSEEEWKEYRYVRYMPDGYLRDQGEAANREEYPARYPEEYAAFDEGAWFNGYYSIVSATPERYMEQEGLDAEGFKQAMFLEWADRKRCFFNGYCVTVDGTPIQFQFYRDLEGEVVGPKVEHERILIPLRAAAEALDLTVEWKSETNEVVCSNGEIAVTFTLDSTQYSGGTLDVAPHAEKGITYLPLRALGETLDCGVTWLQDFATAALTTPQPSKGTDIVEH